MADIQIDLQQLDLQQEERRRSMATELNPEVRAKWSKALFSSICIRFAMMIGVVFTLCLFYTRQLLTDLAIGVLITLVYFNLSIIFAKHIRIDFTRVNYVLDTIGNWKYLFDATILLNDLFMVYFFFWQRNVKLTLLLMAIMMIGEITGQLNMIQCILGGRNRIYPFNRFQSSSIELSIRLSYTAVCTSVVVSIVTHHEHVLMNVFQ